MVIRAVARVEYAVMPQRFRPTPVISVALLLALTAGTRGAAPARPGQPKPPTTPDPHVAAAVGAVESNALPAFAASVAAELTPALNDLGAVDNNRITTLASFREFGRYFGRVEAPQPAQQDTLKWLAAQPRLLPALMMAVTDADAPADVLAVLSALRQDSPDRLDEYADLTAAVCVVWDAAPVRVANRPTRGAPATAATRPAGNPDPAGAVKRFKYYANPKGGLRCDFKTLPWQIAIYAVDTAVTDDEITWAARNYGNRRQLSRVYFEVPYDMSAFHAGARQADALPYTLPNIRQYGGVCLDQAYFAANVGKALGQPAAVCLGQSGSQGELHAWIGYLQPAGKFAAWNFYEGRYGDMMFWSGQVVDPQGGPPATDADVCLLSELTASPAANRLASVALCKSRDLVDDRRAPELYMRAIDMSPGNRPAWMALAQLGADRKLTIPEIDRVSEVVHRFAVERYPDFAFAVFRRIITGRSTDEQLVAMANIARLFAVRPDLVAAVRMAQGDLMRDANRPKEALTAYTDAMSDGHRTGPILPQAMERADTLLRATGEKAKLAALYQSVWSRTPPPEPSGYAELTPFCIIGHRYAALLREMGRATEANAVDQRVGRYEAGKT